jgi:26 proteasome complex subunit DSS1
MSSSASTSKQPETPKTADVPKPEDAQPHLGVLEEDDEFEEFAVADWDDSQTDLAQLGGSAQGAVGSGDKLWEDNWDDDDIEEEFSLQLRNELEKVKGSDAMEQ